MTDFKLSFAGIFPYPVIIIVFLLFLTVFIYYYLYKSVLKKKGRNLILFILRVLILVLVFILLIKPNISYSYLKKTRVTIAILVDNSASMGIAINGQKKWHTAVNLLQKHTSWLKQIKKHFDTTTYSFSSAMQIEEIHDASKIVPDGMVTDIKGSLSSIQESIKDKLAAAVVISDGLDTGLTGNLIHKVPVYTIAVSPDSIPADSLIKSVSIPKRLFYKNKSWVSVIIDHKKLKNTNTDLEFYINNNLIEKRRITFNEKLQVQRFSFIPQKKGWLNLSFYLKESRDEVLTQNNRTSSTVQVIDPGIKILYISGQLSWENKFLKRTLEQDPNVEFHAFLRTGQTKLYAAGIRNRQFPANLKELKNYDIVVFANIEKNFFTDDFLHSLHEYVSEYGGAFMMLGGLFSYASGGYGNTYIESMLPVNFNQVSQGYVEQDFIPSLADNALSHPLLSLSSQDEQNKKIWQSMPPLGSFNQAQSVKPGAEVLLTHPVFREKNTDNLLPILSVQRYGRGQTIAFMTDTTWKWEFAKVDTTRTYYTEFWRQVIRWLYNFKRYPFENREELFFLTYESDFMSMLPVKIEILFNPDYQVPIKNIRIHSTLFLPDGTSKHVDFAKTKDRENRHHHILFPKQTGTYKIKGSIIINQDYKKDFSDTFHIKEQQLEYQSTGSNLTFLKDLAKKSGGRSIKAENIKEFKNILEKELKPQEKKIKIMKKIDLASSFPFYFFIIFLLCLEWLYRKRNNLL